MSIDARIPLQTRTVDINQGINQLVGAVGMRKRQDIARERTDLQRNRDEDNAKTANLQREQIIQQIAANGETRKYVDTARDVVMIQGAAQSGDLLQVKQLLTDRITDLTQSSEDTTIETNLLGLFDSNPAQAMEQLNGVVSGLSRLGFIQGVAGANGVDSQQAWAPVTLVNKETGEKVSRIPVYNKNTQTAEFKELQTGDDWEISTETPEEKRQADALSKIQTEVQKLQAATEEKPRTTAAVKKAEAAQEKANKAFDSIDKIRVNNNNLRDARQAVIDGAGTGAILSLVPSFREQSVRLDAAQGRLGLDVVQATTFGALSKGELDLSKAIALPVGLDGEPLVKWIDDKIAANEKMANYLERQAVFLSETDEEGNPNSLADWKKSEQAIMNAAMQAIDATEENIIATMEETGMDRSSVLAEIRRRYESGGP